MTEDISIIRTTHNAQRYYYAQNQTRAPERIHVALAVYDPSGNYSQHAGVVITSIFEHTHNPVTVHILHDDTLTPDNRQKFIRTTEKYHQTLNFINVTEHKDDTLVKLSGIYTVGACFRMFLPDVLPELDKIIYLDCDVVVNLDISELWKIDTQNFCIAGAADKHLLQSFTERFRHKLLGCDSVTYINSGVLVINLNLIRKTGSLLRNSLRYYSHYKYLILYWDQDILNALFDDSRKVIDGRFNKFSPDNYDELDDCIIHSPDWNKTWLMTGKPAQKLYWHMYLRSAWGENYSSREIAEIISNSAQRSSQRIMRNCHSSLGECLYESVKSIARKIFYTNTPVTVLRYIFMGIWCRIK